MTKQSKYVGLLNETLFVTLETQNVMLKPPALTLLLN